MDKYFAMVRQSGKISRYYLKPEHIITTYKSSIGLTFVAHLLPFENDVKRTTQIGITEVSTGYNFWYLSVNIGEPRVITAFIESRCTPQYYPKWEHMAKRFKRIAKVLKLPTVPSVTPNDLKKGTEVRLSNGFYAILEDNRKGNTRLAKVFGLCTEVGSVYAHDIQRALLDGRWVQVVPTPSQAELKASLVSMGMAQE